MFTLPPKLKSWLWTLLLPLDHPKDKLASRLIWWYYKTEPYLRSRATRKINMGKLRDQLMFAVQNCDVDQVKILLLNPKCDPMSKEKDGWTALMYAALRGHEACIHLLLSKSDPLAQCNDGLTALMWSTILGHTSCVNLLLPVSDALSKEKDGWTALMWAALGGHISCIQMLLPVSDIYEKNKNKHTASEIATESGHIHLVKIIEAYVLTQSEKTALDSVIPAGTVRNRGSLRI